MLKELFKKIKRIEKVENQNDGVKRTKINTTEKKRTEVKKAVITPPMDIPETLECKYRIIATGEIVTFRLSDQEAFDKMMGLGKAVQLIFG